MHTLYEWFLKLCFVSYPPEICSILKEYNNDTNLQIMQKSVYLWDSGGEGGGGGQGIITRCFFESIVSETGRGQLVTCVLT